MRQPFQFETLESFIEHLAAKPHITGILQYGNRDYRNMEKGGDFDLNVIVAPDQAGSVAGLHLHVQDIPVDCGIISESDLFEESPPSDYHCVLLRSEILYDAKGTLAERMAIIRESWALYVPAIREGEIAFERFIRQHIVDKFQHRSREFELYTRLFLSGNVFWLLELWMKIERLNPYDFKGALLRMKEVDAELYALFDAFESTQGVEEKLAITKVLNEQVMAKIGGPWREDEVIFHYAHEDQRYSEAEKQQAINLIF